MAIIVEGIVVVVVIIICVEELLVVLARLHFTTIAFLAEGEVEVVAVETDPVAFPLLAGSGVGLGVVVLERGAVLAHCYSS